jgi:hypothetical protein
MKKYEMSYTRKFPDHRVGNDYRLKQILDDSPIRLMKVSIYLLVGL